MNLGAHAVFIVGAYAAATAIVAGLIVWIFVDRWRLTRVLDDLEAHGITRRSERASEEKQ